MIAFGLEASTAFRLDTRKFQLLRKNLRKLLHREVDFEDVSAGSITGLALAVSSKSPGERAVPGSPSPCPTPPVLRRPKRKLGISICGIGMLTKSFPFLPISSP